MAELLRLAHRGDHRRAPENTLAALEASLGVPGCDGVEFDVRASADGRAVLLHDETLARVFGRPERPADLAAADLVSLGVATLAGAMALLPGDAFVDVELKEAVVEAVIADIAAVRGDPPARIALSSFDEAVLVQARRLAPAWPRWLNATHLDPATLDRAAGLGCTAIAAEWRAVDAAGMRRAAKAGLEVVAWTVRRRPTAGRLARLGVRAMCVEGPALDPGA